MGLKQWFTGSNPQSGVGIVLSGPNHDNKQQIVHQLTQQQQCWRSVSVTTRSPRRDEVPGMDYYFVSTNDFEAKFRNNEFLEYANLHGSWYGTLRSPVERHLKRGTDVLFTVNVQGGMALQQKLTPLLTVFVEPADQAVLTEYLRRAGFDEAAVQSRLETAYKEAAIAHKRYDYVVSSQQIDDAVATIGDGVNQLRSQ